jgi:hypothetical protein
MGRGQKAASFVARQIPLLAEQVGADPAVAIAGRVRFRKIVRDGTNALHPRAAAKDIIR